MKKITSAVALCPYAVILGVIVVVGVSGWVCLALCANAERAIRERL